MNNYLWQQVLAFNFDENFVEYGFFTRLADENGWTEDFCEKAVLEYKKFMYLAATADAMVSPSEIVDVVWHQHLIFTQSYQAFCQILGKAIQHIPSTHSKAEYAQFQAAKSRTKELYEANFGPQPTVIWERKSILASLKLPAANLPNWTLFGFAALGLLLLSVPFYYVLKPLYLQIDGLLFLPLFAMLLAIVMLGLELFNRYCLRQVLKKMDTDSFLLNLRPYDMVYLKNQKLNKVVNGVLNELVQKNRLIIDEVNHVHIKPGTSEGLAPGEQQVLLLLEENGPMAYAELVKQLLAKPIFSTRKKTIDAAILYILHSKPFSVLLLVNFTALGMVLSWGVIRLITGIQREKPIIWLFLLLIICAATALYFITRLGRLFDQQILPDYYRYQIVPQQPTQFNWQWQYFQFEHLVLAPAMIIPIRKYEQDQAIIAASGDGGSSGGGDGGGSCGGGCGGCGS
jgi:uncharacterized protein (TIGR04222 family)